MDKKQLDIYYNLLGSYLNNEITVDSFVSKYMSLFKNDKSNFGDYYEILNNIFLDSDEYDPETEFGERFVIGEKEFKKRCQKSFELLKQKMSAAKTCGECE